MKSWFAFALFLATSLARAPELRAAPSEGEVAKLFAAGEKNTTPSVDAARQIARALKRANRDDLRIDYSFGLVLANQRRYAEAEPLLARYVAAQRDDLPAHTVKLWNEMQSGQITVALDSMTEIATLLSQQTAESPEARDAARFVGVCLAVLDRVPPKIGDEEIVESKSRQIRALLGKHYVSALDEGWQSVGVLADEMLAAENERIDRAQAEAAEKARQVSADLHDTAKQIAAQREKGQSSLDTARDSQRELQNIRQQFTSLSLDRARVAAQIVAVQAQITAIQNTPIVVSQGSSASSTSANGNVVTRASAGVGVLGIDSIAQLQSFSLALAQLNKQAFDMDRVLVGLQTRGAELAGISQIEFKKLAESEKTAASAAKRAQRLSRQLDRPESAAARHSSTAAKMARFSTYAPLPYEQETKRVLGWFAK